MQGSPGRAEWKRGRPRWLVLYAAIAPEETGLEIACPSCGAVVPDDDAAFCPFCGGAIERPRDLEMGCPACGALNLFDANFCASCGEPLESEEKRRGAGAVLPFGLGAAGGGAMGAIGASAIPGGGGAMIAGAGVASAAPAMGGAGAASAGEALAGAGSALPSAPMAAGNIGPGGADILASAPAAPPPAAPPPPPAAPPAPPPAPPPAARVSQAGQAVTSGGSKVLSNALKWTAIGGVVAGAGIAGLSLLAAILMFTGDPAPCTERRSVASNASATAVATRWVAFRAAAPGATLEITEQEATSQAVSYLGSKDVPIRDLQMFFCADGKAEAKGKVEFLGRDVNVLFRGTLDVSGGQNRIVIDSVKAGNLPSAVGEQIVEQLLDRNDARNVPLGVTLASSSSSDGKHRLVR